MLYQYKNISHGVIDLGGTRGWQSGGGACRAWGGGGGRSRGSFLWGVVGEPGTGPDIVLIRASGSPHCPQA